MSLNQAQREVSISCFVIDECSCSSLESRRRVDIFRVVLQTIVKKKAFLCSSHCRDLFQRLHFLASVTRENATPKCCSHCRDLFQRLHFLSHVKMRLLTSQRTRRLLRQVRITAVGSKTTPLTPYLSNISIQHVQLKRAPAVL